MCATSRFGHPRRSIDSAVPRSSPLPVAEGSMRRPRRYRLRLYVAAARALLRVLTAISDWSFEKCTLMRVIIMKNLRNTTP